MKAIVWTKYGSPDGLQLREVEKPTFGDNDLLIRVHATTVTAGDTEVRGLKFPLWLALPIRLYMGVIRPRNKILGQEMAGEIEAVGRAVKQFKIGDQVFGTTGFGFGAYAEYLRLPAVSEDGALALKPTNQRYEEAAAIPVAGLEALHFLRKANIQRGQKVLVYGAGGSIGTIAVQLAKYFGAVVTAVDSKGKLDMLRSIGADRVIDYQREDFTKDSTSYDAIIDVIGKSSFWGSLRSLKQNGIYLLVNAGLCAKIVCGLDRADERQASDHRGSTAHARRFDFPQRADRSRRTEGGHRPVLAVGTDRRGAPVCRNRAEKRECCYHDAACSLKRTSASLPARFHGGKWQQLGEKSG